MLDPSKESPEASQSPQSPDKYPTVKHAFERLAVREPCLARLATEGHGARELARMAPALSDEQRREALVGVLGRIGELAAERRAVIAAVEEWFGPAERAYVDLVSELRSKKAA